MTSPAIAQIQDPTKNIPDNVSGVQLIEMIAAATATKTVLVPLMNKIKTGLTTAGALRYKILTNTATAKDRTDYAAIQNDLTGLQSSINAAGQLDADTMAMMQEQLLSAKLQRIQGDSNSITFAEFTDFLQYIFRTQALNPYSRERVCDIDFIDMLTNIAGDIGDQQAVLNELKALIEKTVSSL